MIIKSEFSKTISNFTFLFGNTSSFSGSIKISSFQAISSPTLIIHDGFVALPLIVILPFLMFSLKNSLLFSGNL
jgi:hypothetical protein